MNEKINALLSELSPELQEKAKGIKTQEELNEFLSENDIELPEDALEAVSGGCGEPRFYEEGTIFRGCCPDCGGDLLFDKVIKHYANMRTIARCLKTGNTFSCHYKQEYNSKWTKW